MPKRTPYNMLPLVPLILADSILSEVYTGKEMGNWQREPEFIDKIESLRQNMTLRQRREFPALCDKRCEAAYNAKADWIEKIMKKGHREQLCIWFKHWLSAYINNRDNFRRQCEVDVAWDAEFEKDLQGFLEANNIPLEDADKAPRLFAEIM